MKTSQLVWIGIRGRVIALNKTTGEQVWATRLRGSDFANVLLEDDKVFAADYGELYCMEALTGRVLWHNKLKGYGIGLATIATAKSGGSMTPALAGKRRQDEECAAAATTSA